MIRRIVRFASALVACAAVLVGAGAAFEAFSRRQVVRDFQIPGRLIDIGGRGIFLNCRGTGSPTVVFESGLGILGSLAWPNVPGEVAKFARACTYSRAGLPGSDPADRPLTGAGVASDLHEALQRAGEQPPLILVGHSAGGPQVTLYTKYFPADVAGLVFVDASHPGQRERFRVAGIPRLDPTPFQRLVGRFAWTGITRTGIGRIVPIVPLSPDASDDERTIAAYAPASLVAESQELAAQEMTWPEALASRDLGSRPLVVLTAGRSFLIEGALGSETERYHQALWEDLQKDMVRWSRVSTQEVLPLSGHCIQCDDPDAVIAAVKWVIDRIPAK